MTPRAGWAPWLYALPALPVAFLGLPMYVYIPAAYGELAGVGLTAAGLILFLGRLLDLITDPLVGVWTDRYRQRVRRGVWMLAGMPVLAVGAWLLFHPPADATPLYLFGAVSLTYLGWTLFVVPYFALGAELAHDGRGHMRMAISREGGLLAGTLIALVLPALVGVGDPLSLIAVVFVVLLPLGWLGVLPLERRATASSAASPASHGLLASWRSTSLPARQLLWLHFANALANGIPGVLFILYVEQTLQLDSQATGWMLLLYFIIGLACLPAWQAWARRCSPFAAWRHAMALASLGFIPAVLLGPGDQAWFIVVLLITGAAVGADVALPAALQAQVAARESDDLGRPRSGALFGFWGMASKLALAVAVGLALPLVEVLGQLPGEPATGEVVPWVYAGLPILLKLGVIWLSYRVRPDADPPPPGPSQETDHVATPLADPPSHPVDRM